MQKIMPHLWFDTAAKEAALFYCSLFEDSRLLHATFIPDTPSGDAELVDFILAGQRFQAISAGPYFTFNPTFSLMVSCSTAEDVDRLWKALSEGGTELMPLDAYPFSGRYAWVQDRYGLSWQLMLTDTHAAPGQRITVNMLFSGDACGKAEEAARYFTSVFPDAEMGFVSPYAEGESDNPKAKVNFASFSLFGTSFSAMDNGVEVDYNFNEAVSLLVICEDQAELDAYWEKLSADPEAEQCGWLKDRFGVSWQLVPSLMDEVMHSGDAEAIQRVTVAFLEMKKFDIEALRAAFAGA